MEIELQETEESGVVEQPGDIGKMNYHLSTKTKSSKWALCYADNVHMKITGRPICSLM